jgi:hypothetical protein
MRFPSRLSIAMITALAISPAVGAAQTALNGFGGSLHSHATPLNAASLSVLNTPSHVGFIAPLNGIYASPSVTQIPSAYPSAILNGFSVNAGSVFDGGISVLSQGAGAYAGLNAAHLNAGSAQGYSMNVQAIGTSGSGAFASITSPSFTAQSIAGSRIEAIAIGGSASITGARISGTRSVSGNVISVTATGNQTVANR